MRLSSTAVFLERFYILVVSILLFGSLGNALLSGIDIFALRPEKDAPIWLYWLCIDGIVLGLVASMCLLGTFMRSANVTGICTIALALLAAVQLCLTVYSIKTSDPRRHFSRDQPRSELYMIWGLSIYALEGGIMALSCLIGGIYSRAEEVDDGISAEDPESFRRPLLQRTPPAPAGPRTGPDTPSGQEWSRRMKELYGLDTTVFTYQPGSSHKGSTAPRIEPSSSERGKASSKGACIIS
eukprot:gene19841-26534_t